MLGYGHPVDAPLVAAQGGGGPLSQFYALLVGIGDYQASSTPKLKSPANDLPAFAQLLRTRYGVPAGHVCKLRDARATREGIARAFAEHLIAQARPGDAVLLYYSGHGSQAPTVDPTVEPDGLDETIVPYDGRMPGVYDIRDKELGAWIAGLGRRGVTNVTVILDKCHAGSGWRAADRGEAEPRAIPRDERRTQPALQDWNGQPLSDPASWRPHPDHVFIAACLDVEQSYGCYFPASPDAQSGGWFGVLTYYPMSLS